MHVVELFQSFLVGVLVAYLSFTDTLATHIATLIEPQHIAHRADTPSTPSHTPSEELTFMSRIFGTGGTNRLLTEHVGFQESLRAAAQHSAVIIPSLDPQRIAETVEQSLVNVFCELETESYTRTTTGTGFFIHEQGVILTNAHVAQFLLLEGTQGDAYKTECTIRTGNPASPRYRAELLFISPTWIFQNARLVSTHNPRGTGEYDYALLYVASTLDNTPLPESYPGIQVHTEYLSKKLTSDTVITGGYPAERLSREGPQAALIPKVADTTIRELYTFGSNYADIFAITESPVGEQGASGGPVVHPSLGVIGLVVTKGDPVTEGERSLRALTLSYIDRTIREETGFSLMENTRGDLTRRGTVFKEALAPFLSKLLVYELK